MQALRHQAAQSDLFDLSAEVGAVSAPQWAKNRRDGASAEFALHVTAVSDQVGGDDKEPASWSTSAPQNADPAKAVAMGFSWLRSVSSGWLDMRLSKTCSGRRMVTVPLCPNRNWHKPQTNTTHVTLSLKGGCNFAAAFCASAWTLYTRCARPVHVNHTPMTEVCAC